MAELNLPPSAYLSWIEVDLEAVRHNARLVRGLLPDRFPLFGVVKADAYGHGAVTVSQILLEEGYAMLCVARVEEAAELRNAGIEAPILVLAPPLAEQAALAVQYDSAIVVCDPEHIDAVKNAAAATQKIPSVHLKIDTGMGRLGASPEKADDLAREIISSPQPLKLEGVMAHFPSADERDPTLTNEQITRFSMVQQQLRGAGIDVPFWHTSNTAGILQHPTARFTAVRTGIALYGQYPGPEVEHKLDLRPAMALRTRVSFIKEVPAGTGLSYGHTFYTQRPSRIATLPLGYADGYPRHASNRTEMLLHGRRVPVVGRVCMDHTLIDVTEVPEAAIGSIVTAFGWSHDTDDILSAEEVAYRFDSLGYELTTRIGKRLPRFRPFT